MPRQSICSREGEEGGGGPGGVQRIVLGYLGRGGGRGGPGGRYSIKKLGGWVLAVVQRSWWWGFSAPRVPPAGDNPGFL